MTVGDNHEVAVRIGIAIQHNITVRGALDHQMFRVLSGESTVEAAEKTTGRVFILEILVTPRSPDPFHENLEKDL